ncbi:hypothetical protein CALCODRAFT_488181 [Calocera cornea HHB12733]|uniref:Uncharacterized protein n=1 Tax=Calocera cornea HHB12733 TaxID=1353952 RepID=A0A165CNU9_9BASI|nr:hypothetical protein CALCODRAFT_488181 [Calocera cornea HHB12733]
MRAGIRLLAQVGHAYKPMIHFLGKGRPTREHLHSAKEPGGSCLTPRNAGIAEAHHPGPHPMAPADILERFSAFTEHFKHSGGASQAPSGASSGGEGEGAAYRYFWEAPERVWVKGRTIDEAEMEAIDSGGASKW